MPLDSRLNSVTPKASSKSFIRLETGDRQPEAIKLYASSGFEPIPRFGPFVDDPRSLCFEKRL